MSPDEIRAVELTVENKLMDGERVKYSPDINEKKFVILREIAAQLAESNEREAKADQLRQESLELHKKNTAKIFGDDKPTISPGAVVKIVAHDQIGESQYAAICPDCGRRPHPIPDDEALQIIAEIEKQSPARPQ